MCESALKRSLDSKNRLRFDSENDTLLAFRSKSIDYIRPFLLFLNNADVFIIFIYNFTTRTDFFEASVKMETLYLHYFILDLHFLYF